jgi:hypothetical protein
MGDEMLECNLDLAATKKNASVATVFVDTEILTGIFAS